MVNVLQGQAALITGGGRGIGRFIAESFARAGAQVAICARTPSQISAVAADLTAMGADVLAVPCDATDRGQVAALMAEVDAKFGHLHVLVNNAGSNEERRAIASSLDTAWWRTVEANLLTTYLVTRAAIPLLARSAPSRVINVGSGLGHEARPGNSAYSAAKAGVRMLTRCLAQEVWRLGIDVNELVPGPVATDLTRDNMTAGGAPPFTDSERVKSPAEVAELALWLATRSAGGPTGQTFSLARRPF